MILAPLLPGGPGGLNSADTVFILQSHERDRDRFRKYVPLCKLVAEAGWEPITAAR